MRAITHLSLSLLTFLAVAGIVRSMTPDPLGNPPPGTGSRTIADKLLYFDDHKTSIDLLFLGSSRMFAGIVPPRFDAEMKGRGMPLRSFNLAMLAMHADETDGMIRQVLAMKPKRLRWAVIELDYWNGHVGPELELRPRTILWHDLSGTVSASRSLLLYSKLPRKKRIHQISSRLLHFGARLTALGRGPRTVSHLWQHGKRMHPAWLAEDGGYQEPAWGHGAVLKDPDGYLREVDGLREYNRWLQLARQKKSSDWIRSKLAVFNVQAVESQVARLRRAGVIPVYVIPPGLAKTPHLSFLEWAGVVEHLLAFNDPDAFPDLFLVENRWDPLHLNRQGADAFSALLAEHMAALMAGSGAG